MGGTWDHKDELIEVQHEMLEARARPDADALGSVDARWGELRSLLNAPLSGGEGWSEWAPLLEAWPEQARGQVFGYVSDIWREAIADLDAMRHAFWLRVLARHAEVMRGVGVDTIDPPILAADVDRAEKKLGVTLPEPMRAIATRVTGGFELDDELGLFDLSYVSSEMTMPGLRAQIEHNLAGAHNEDSIQWYQQDIEYHDLQVATLARVIAAMPELGEGRFIEAAHVIDHLEDADLTPANTAVMIGWWMEGNHGDWADFLITRGSMSGRVIRYVDMIHGGAGGRHSKFFGMGHVVDWLVDRYFTDVFIGDLWHPLPWPHDFEY